MLGCVDTSSDDSLDAELNDNVFELAKSISHYHNGVFSIAHAWWDYDELFLKRRMDSHEFAVMVKANLNEITTRLDRFLVQHDSSVDADNVHLIQGTVPEGISAFILQNGVDLVVMGTVARSGVTGMIMGNTAETILNHVECSVLAIKPSGFVSPIRMND